MATKKMPARFRSEKQEADWWAKNQDYIAQRFQGAKATGALAKGSVARLARQKATAVGRLRLSLSELPKQIRARALD
jgi:hypothetical protein